MFLGERKGIDNIKHCVPPCFLNHIANKLSNSLDIDYSRMRDIASAHAYNPNQMLKSPDSGYGKSSYKRVHGTSSQSAIARNHLNKCTRLYRVMYWRCVIAALSLLCFELGSRSGVASRPGREKAAWGILFAIIYAALSIPTKCGN